MSEVKRKLVKAQVTKLSLCPCGFSVLAEHIVLGSEYRLDPTDRAKVTYICGGCQRQSSIFAVYVEAKGESEGGYLPEGIFTVTEDQIAFHE